MSQRLFILQPQPLVTGQINDSFNEEYPTYDIPIKSVDILVPGDYEDVVKAGMTVVFGSAPGLDDLGRQRIRRVFSDQELLPGRSSQGSLDGEINVAPNDYFTIYDDFRVWSKMPWIMSDGYEFKDADLQFITEGGGTTFPPVANIGPGFADEISPDTGTITVYFDGSNSFGMPIDSNIFQYIWDFKDGTIIDGGGWFDSYALVSFPAGFRWASLTVVSNGFGGVQHTARCPILADDPENSLCVDLFQVRSRRSTQAGQQYSFHILSDIPRVTYLDGTLVMFWDRKPSGPADRSHMKFIGWHHGDSASIQFQETGTLRDTTIDCLDVAGKLDTLPGLAQIMVSVDEPTKWGEVYHPNMEILMQYLLNYHTTALELADYFDVTQFANNADFIRRQVDEGTIWQQLVTQVKSLTPDRLLTCNRLGQLAIWNDQNVWDPFFRPDDPQANLEGYISEIRFDHMRPPRVGWIRGSGVLEGWYPTPTTIEVEYTVNATAEFFAGATTITVAPIPVDFPAGTELVFSFAQTEVTAAPATAGATSLTMVPLTDTVDIFIPAKVTIEEPGPSYIPTVFCIAPGTTPGQGSQFITVGNKLTENQAALNSNIGLHYGRMNSEYGIATITLKGMSDLGIDPGNLIYVETGPMAARYVPQRALPFFPCRGIVLEVSTQYEYTENGRVETHTLTFERETFGIPAVTITGNEV